MKRAIVLLFVLLILVIIIILNYNRNTYQRFTYQNNNFGKCLSIVKTNSLGLYTDASIVCEIINKLPATPYFYYETCPSHFYPSGYLFANIDITNFQDMLPKNILCKTHSTYDILSNFFGDKKTIIYTGFTSFDRYDPEITKDYNKIIHIAGKSPFKGTIDLIKTWSNSDLPLLTVICRDYIGKKCIDIVNKYKTNNVKIIFENLDENSIQRYQNEYGIHICTSEHEGFGHYLNEARSTKSVVLYTDAPPMNEFFTPYLSGIPIKAKLSGYRNSYLCPMFKCIPKEIVNSVKYVLSLSTEKKREIGEQSRNEYLHDRERFRVNITKLVTGKGEIPKIIHYIWISKDSPYENVNLPQKYEKYISSWKNKNSEYEFKFWSGQDAFNLIKKYPQFLDFYNSAKKVITKYDFIRFLIIYEYGGLYIDTDFFCRKNISQLLECESYFIFEPKEHYKNNFRMLFNGFFASYRNNPLIWDWLITMSLKNPNNIDILDTTGPIGFYKYFCETNNDIRIGNTCHVIPFIDTGKFSKDCEDSLNNFACTLWSDGSGWGSDYNNTETENIKNTLSIKNPLNEKNLIIPTEYPKVLKSKNIELEVNNKDLVTSNPYDCIFIAHAHKENNIDSNIKYQDSNSKNKLFVESTALLNSLNIVIV